MDAAPGLPVRDPGQQGAAGPRAPERQGPARRQARDGGDGRAQAGRVGGTVREAGG